MPTAHLDLAALVEASAGNVTRANDALGHIDAVVMPAVINRTQTSTPGSPAAGDRYIAGTGVAGWTGTRNGTAAQTFQANDFIYYTGSGWVGWAPEEGWFAAVAAEDIVVIYSGSAWVFYQSYKVATAITTTGTTQGAAVQLAFGVSQLTVVVAGNTAAKLPAAEVGAVCVIANADAADTALIFPASGDAINALAADASFSLAAGKTVILTAINATTWYGVLSA
ncbi:MAG TPA: DUF2793 domain-containing protein [Planctomycetota bacterium]|nr:DUF2793 domain-containing protein [Planctomycetota bacterium]